MECFGASLDGSTCPRSGSVSYTLTVLRSKDYAPTVTAIELPADWLKSWEAWLDQSETVYGEIEHARTARKTHASLNNMTASARPVAPGAARSALLGWLPRGFCHLRPQRVHLGLEPAVRLA